MDNYFVLGIIIQYYGYLVSLVILALDIGSFSKVAPVSIWHTPLFIFFILFYFVLAYPHFLVL